MDVDKPQHEGYVSQIDTFTCLFFEYSRYSTAW